MREINGLEESPVDREEDVRNIHYDVTPTGILECRHIFVELCLQAEVNKYLINDSFP